MIFIVPANNDGVLKQTLLPCFSINEKCQGNKGKNSKLADSYTNPVVQREYKPARSLRETDNFFGNQIGKADSGRLSDFQIWVERSTLLF